MSDSQAFAVPLAQNVDVRPKECFTCRVIGTAALAGVGFYALNQTRPHAPGSIMGKRVMAGVGVCTSPCLYLLYPLPSGVLSDPSRVC